jgi:hypothetical protein
LLKWTNQDIEIEISYQEEKNNGNYKILAAKIILLVLFYFYFKLICLYICVLNMSWISNSGQKWWSVIEDNIFENLDSVGVFVDILIFRLVEIKASKWQWE